MSRPQCTSTSAIKRLLLQLLKQLQLQLLLAEDESVRLSSGSDGRQTIDDGLMVETAAAVSATGLGSRLLLVTVALIVVVVVLLIMSSLLSSYM